MAKLFSSITTQSGQVNQHHQTNLSSSHALIPSHPTHSPGGVTMENHKQPTDTTAHQNDSPGGIVTEHHKRTTENGIAKSALFSLPREIRTMIYSYALANDAEISLTKSAGIPEPALLSASKTLRAETFETFYLENAFVCQVRDFDAAPVRLAVAKALQLAPESESLRALAKKRPSSILNCKVSFRGKRSWENLVAWLLLCLARKCPGLDCTDADDAEHKLLKGLFETVLEGPEISVDALGFLCKAMRSGFVALNRDWAEE
jgi:hypothetical protein